MVKRAQAFGLAPRAALGFLVRLRWCMSVAQICALALGCWGYQATWGCGGLAVVVVCGADQISPLPGCDDRHGGAGARRT